MPSKCIRIIPRLDIKGPNLVKGIQMEGLRVLGKPEDFAYQYYLDGADELLFIDVVASLYGRNNIVEIVERIAERIFIPLTVGGGIRTLKDFYSVLRAGADKVALNTAAINNPSIIRDAAKNFGSQCVVISIEAKKNDEGYYEAYTDNGRERTGVDVFEWAKRVCDLGAGEIMVTAVDRDGTGQGYDTRLVEKLSKNLPIPVIAAGGAGKPEHIVDVINTANVDAIAAASIFHYYYVLSINKETKEFEEGNLSFLTSIKKGDLSHLLIPEPVGIKNLKDILKKVNIYCRV
ncbi:MAG: imidazole glycerol phosphate synthase subunit HisF [Desulfobacterales bacterium]|nr:imidazole glycerol phosphate synthase subunit HisF [Desulfobacterales bacterium]MBF0398341.1 imidazole glycerol phosphate synthase subunit HisF [Desulfobacterales bacterium]